MQTQQSSAQTQQSAGLNLEVEEIESRMKHGCHTSTTRHLCTCPVPGSVVTEK